MSFVSAIRDDNLAQPNSPRFSESKWRAAFARASKPTERDHEVFSSGLWFADKFARLRGKLDSLPLTRIPREKRIRMAVGIINCHTEAVFRTQYQPGPSPSPAHDEDQQTAFEFRFQYGVVQHIGAFVAAARHLLAYLALLPSPLPGVPRLTREEEVAAIGDAMNLEVFYDTYELLWADCLWNEWRVAPGVDLDEVEPTDPALEEALATSEYRRSRVEMGLYSNLLKAWNALPQPQRRKLAAYPAISRIDRVGKRKRLHVSPEAERLDLPPRLTPAQAEVTQVYSEDLLAAPLPGFPEVSVSVLLRAWALLAPIGRLSAIHFPEPNLESVTTPGHLLPFAPVHSIASFEQAIASHLRVGPAVARKVVELFLFDGSSRTELWHAPLVRLGGDACSVVVAGLAQGNPLRTAEYWMRKFSLDLSARGGRYEDHVREELRRVNRLSNVLVLPGSLTFEAGGISEQIDLVVRLGDTVLIGEIKTSITPSVAFERHNYRNVLTVGIRQARRKSEFVRQHTAAFLQRVGWEITPGALKVVPVVVTNLPIGLSPQNDGIAVVDTFILLRYFGDPRHGGVTQLEFDGQVTTWGETPFYNSESEAETRLEEYLHDPPQLHIARRFLRSESVNIPTLGEDDRPATYEEYLVHLPEELYSHS